jgi:hypothetical protein
MEQSVWPGVPGGREVGCLAMPCANILHDTHPKRLPNQWIRRSLKLGRQRILSFPWRRRNAWSNRSGNFSRRNMVGRFADPCRFRARISPPCSCSPIGCSEPEPHCHGGLCATDKQPEMGLSAGQCQLIHTGYRIAKRIGCQCVTDHHTG